MGAIAWLKAFFKLDTSNFKAGAKDIASSTDTFQKKLSGVGRVIGAAFSFGAVLAAGKAFVKWASDVSAAAENAGILTSEMMALNQVAVEADLEISDMQNLLTKLQNTLYDAASGSEEAASKFEKIGLSITDLAALDPAAMLQAVAAAAADSEIPLQALSEIFGDKLGPKAMTALMDIAENGLPSVSEEAARTADAIEDMGDRWAGYAEKAKTNIAISLSWMEKMISRMGAFLGGAYVGGLVGGFDAMRDFDGQREEEQQKRITEKRERQRRTARQIVKMAEATEAESNASKREKAANPFRDKIEALRAQKIADTGRGINADSMAQMGGFIGNQRPGLGIADRQMKLQVESNKIQGEIQRLTVQMNDALQDIRDASPKGGP